MTPHSLLPSQSDSIDINRKSNVFNRLYPSSCMLAGSDVAFPLHVTDGAGAHAHQSRGHRPRQLPNYHPMLLRRLIALAVAAPVMIATYAWVSFQLDSWGIGAFAATVVVLPALILMRSTLIDATRGRVEGPSDKSPFEGCMQKLQLDRRVTI